MHLTSGLAHAQGSHPESRRRVPVKARDGILPHERTSVGNHHSPVDGEQGDERPKVAIQHARALRLRTLVDAYQSGLAEPLTPAERRAIPLALARTPLCFIAMIPSVDSAPGARRLAHEVAPDISWALAIVRDLDQWTSVFV